jgi:septum formation protein
MIQAAKPNLVLASGSAGRRALMEAAGLRFTVQPASVNESAVKHIMQNDGAPPDVVALALAAEKARSVSAPGAVVIGADQILVCNGAAASRTLPHAPHRRMLLAGRQAALA